MMSGGSILFLLSLRSVSSVSPEVHVLIIQQELCDGMWGQGIKEDDEERREEII